MCRPGTVRPVEIGGTVAPGFERVRDVFAANFAERGEVGAACCVYRRASRSSTCGAARPRPAARALHASARCRWSPRRPRGRWRSSCCAWPSAVSWTSTRRSPVLAGVRRRGQGGLPVRWLLSHQAGLPATPTRSRRRPTRAGRAPVDRARRRRRRSGSRAPTHGYHAITYGWLVGEVVSRVTGDDLRPGVRRGGRRPARARPPHRAARPESTTGSRR